MNMLVCSGNDSGFSLESAEQGSIPVMVVRVPSNRIEKKHGPE